MSAASVPVDLTNPGQVFACLGLLEAADVLVGEATGAFDWSGRGAVRFWLHVPMAVDPVVSIMEFLAAAQVCSLAPPGSGNTTEAWKVTTRHLPEDSPFPFPDPDSPATLPALLERGSDRVVIDYWGESETTGRDNVKFWGGAGGYPGAALTRDALDGIRDRCVGAATDPFNLSAPQSSSFRFDWRRDYIPIDAGFSLNEHGGMDPVGYPLVELLAAFGLGQARPERREALEYRYQVLGIPQPVVGIPTSDLFYAPVIMRAALGGADLPFPKRRFRMRLGWPAKEGQARAITIVTEEAIA